MMFKQHLLAGSITGIITGIITGATAWYITKNPIAGLAFAGVTVIGSLISDLDTGSVPSRIFALIGAIASIFLMYRGMHKPAAIIGIIYMLLSSPKHRGITHKWIVPIALFIAGIVVTQYPQYWPFVFFIPLSIGISCHLACDKVPPYKII